MTNDGPGIVFMGTPDFAVASLKSLTDNRFDVRAVVTVPDKPSGRGQKLTKSPVKVFAEENGIKVLQPDKLRDPAFISKLRNLNADIFVVVAFRMLPEQIWSIPKLGTFNLHASLLPQYRGAAPINHAIINGEAKTGVTTFLIDKEIDTGKILLTRETPIGPEENAGQLHDRLMEMGAELVVETVKGLYLGGLIPRPQKPAGDTNLKAAPKIFPPDTVIKWNDKASYIHNKIRGLSPYPGAVTQFVSEGKMLKIKIFECRVTEKPGLKPGTISIVNKNHLLVSCGDFNIEVLELQAEGRKRMTASEFLRGIDISGFHAE